MIKNYLAHIQSKSTHERRQHAMQLASGLTAFAVLVWITTLGVRFAMTPAQVAQSNGDTSQVASVVQATQGNATLIVATTTDSGTSGTGGFYSNF